MIKKYVYGMNYNPATKQDEAELTQIIIPAKSPQEADTKLKALVGANTKNIYFSHVDDY